MASLRPSDRPGRRHVRRRGTGANRTVPYIRWRLITLLVVFGLGFGAMLVRLVDVQAVSANRYAVVGRSQRVHSVTLPAQRGSLLDRNGFQLAVSMPQATVYADPQMVRDPAAAARALSEVLQQDESELRAQLTSAGSFVYLARRVDDATAERVRVLEIEGVSLLEEPTRRAPAGALAQSVLGEVGIDDEGLSGLEKQYEKVLAGKPGELVVERDPAGRDIAGGERERRMPVRGRHVVLTLDRDLQFFTEQALAAQITSARARSGIAIVMHPRTGEVLAMANMEAGAKGAAPGPAAYNRAVIDVYEPGSVNKIVTIGGAIDDGKVTASDVMAVPDQISVAGSTFQDAETHATAMWDPTDVMTHSSNAGAILIGQQLGAEGLARYLQQFGLADGPELGFPGEAEGIVPGIDDWSGTTLATLSIGYGLAVTPLQMLAAFNAIANDGVYVAPTLVRHQIDPSGKEKSRTEPERHRAVSEETARTVRDMLVEVVRSGTGTPAAIDGYTVAGKTGTARKAVDGGAGYQEGVYVASFAGFFPAESPRLSAIVVLDEPTPYTGAQASAPVFAQVAAYAARHFQVPRHPAPDTPGGLAVTLGPSSATRP